MFIKRNQDAVISRVQQRVAAWLQLPVSYQEEMQILRYSPGQMYKPHMDANGRMCTVLVYLTGAPPATLWPRRRTISAHDCGFE